MFARILLLPVLAILPLLPAACASPSPEATGRLGAHLTSVNSEQRGIHFRSYVYVPTTASDTDIQKAIARQVKTAIGALQVPQISIDDLNSEHNVDPSTWSRQTLTVADPANPSAAASQVLRVTYPYDDTCVATNDLAGKSTVDFTMLATDYAPNAATLIPACSNDPAEAIDSLWYSYTPTMSSCRTLIQSELKAITTEQRAVGADVTKIGPKEAGRWFIPVTAKLDPPSLPGRAFSPEYDRLFGVGTDKSQLVVYAFFGVNADETSPDDLFGQEAIKFLRTMLTAQPSFRPVSTDPFAMLEDIYVNGQKIANVTYDQMFSWILDQTNYPPEVGTDPNAILALRRQAIAKFTERWIHWDLPISVATTNGQTKNVTVEVRTFYGYEIGSSDIQQHAQWRYLEAFWYGDVFLYTGHSHFGNGPLEPNRYGPQNFNANYQIMLVNSCISYNYYHQDFFNLKPGGTKNLDMIVNGLPAYVQDMGIATGQFLTSLIDGQQHSYAELLRAEELPEPWSPAYDPMRVADGEIDNVFSQVTTPLAVTFLAPVYP